MSLGRLAVEKNVFTLLDAFAVAAARDPRLRLLLIGSGGAEDEVRARADRADLRGRVALTGLLPRSAALARLRRCDLFVFASRTETQGIVLAEAAACRLPIVALDAPGVRETVNDGLDGMVVHGARDAAGRDARRTDAERLGEAIAALAADAARRSAMAVAARANAERFGLERCVARMVELYFQVLR